MNFLSLIVRSFVQNSGADKPPSEVEGETTKSDDSDAQSVSRQSGATQHERLFENLLGLVDTASEVTQIPKALTKLLLEQFHWRTESFYEAFFECASVEAFCANSGIALPTAHNATDAQETCSICVTEQVLATSTGPDCGHCFCQHCWNEYVCYTMKSGTSGVTMLCPAYGCKFPLDDRFITSILAKWPDVCDRYIIWTAKRFVDTNPDYHRCSCERVLRRHVFYDKPLECECGNSRCPNCAEEWHEPIDCQMLRKWECSLKLDVETISWLKKNSKMCPKCKSPIQKNGGCNRIVCAWVFCRFEFCWICLKPWSDHPNHFFLCDLTNSSQHQLDWHKETNANELRCVANFQEATKRNRHYFYKSTKCQEKVWQLFDEDPNFRHVERSNLRRLYRFFTHCGLFIQYSWVFLCYVENSHDVMLFKMHLLSLVDSYETMAEHLLLPLNGNCVWKEWNRCIRNAEEALKLRYECVRRFWKEGTKTDSWHFFKIPNGQLARNEEVD